MDKEVAVSVGVVRMDGRLMFYKKSHHKIDDSKRVMVLSDREGAELAGHIIRELSAYHRDSVRGKQLLRAFHVAMGGRPE